MSHRALGTQFQGAGVCAHFTPDHEPCAWCHIDGNEHPGNRNLPRAERMPIISDDMNDSGPDYSHEDPFSYRTLPRRPKDRR